MGKFKKGHKKIPGSHQYQLGNKPVVYWHDIVCVQCGKIVRGRKDRIYCNQCQQWNRVRRYRKNNPEARVHSRIMSRCCPSGAYSKKGIKNFLSVDDVRGIWKRDLAGNMKRPSIHRLNPKGDYEMTNCCFVELSSHFGEGRRNSNGCLNIAG
jgi:hypothetical protein